MKRVGAPRISSLLAIMIFLLAACASQKPQQPTLPQWTTVPPFVLDAFCVSFHNEGISQDTTINVVKSTQPLMINTATMRALADAAFYGGTIDPAHAADTAAATATEAPIAIPSNCAWRPIDVATLRRLGDTMTLELSPPIQNPYQRGTAGMFARFSLGGDAATWYWLPIVPHGDAWSARMPTALSYRQ